MNNGPKLERLTCDAVACWLCCAALVHGAPECCAVAVGIKVPPFSVQLAVPLPQRTLAHSTAQHAHIVVQCKQCLVREVLHKVASANTPQQSITDSPKPINFILLISSQQTLIRQSEI